MNCFVCWYLEGRVFFMYVGIIHLILPAIRTPLHTLTELQPFIARVLPLLPRLFPFLPCLLSLQPRLLSFLSCLLSI